jgi:hypothetical protein
MMTQSEGYPGLNGAALLVWQTWALCCRRGVRGRLVRAALLLWALRQRPARACAWAAAGGFTYVQNASSSGPVAWMLFEAVHRMGECVRAALAARSGRMRGPGRDPVRRVTGSCVRVRSTVCVDVGVVPCRSAPRLSALVRGRGGAGAAQPDLGCGGGGPGSPTQPCRPHAQLRTRPAKLWPQWSPEPVPACARAHAGCSVVLMLLLLPGGALLLAAEGRLQYMPMDQDMLSEVLANAVNGAVCYASVAGFLRGLPAGLRAAQGLDQEVGRGARRAAWAHAAVPGPGCGSGRAMLPPPCSQAIQNTCRANTSTFRKTLLSVAPPLAQHVCDLQAGTEGATACPPPSDAARPGGGAQASLMAAELRMPHSGGADTPARTFVCRPWVPHSWTMRGCACMCVCVYVFMCVCVYVWMWDDARMCVARVCAAVRDPALEATPTRQAQVASFRPGVAATPSAAARGRSHRPTGRPSQTWVRGQACWLASPPEVAGRPFRRQQAPQP